MERPKIKDYKKDGNTYYHKSTKQNFEFDMSKYLNIVESGYRSQLKEYKKDVADWKLHYDALQSQLKEKGENAEVIRLLKNALEYYHNDKFANRAKSMKSLIEDALDILKTKYNP